MKLLGWTGSREAWHRHGEDRGQVSSRLTVTAGEPTAAPPWGAYSSVSKPVNDYDEIEDSGRSSFICSGFGCSRTSSSIAETADFRISVLLSAVPTERFWNATAIWFGTFIERRQRADPCLQESAPTKFAATRRLLESRTP